MHRLILRRLIETVPVLFIIATVTFFLVRLAPGDPFSDDQRVSPEVLEQLRAHYHLDESLSRQYLYFLGNLLRGDLGPSFQHPNRTVNELIADTFPVSIQLGLSGLVVALLIGLGAGLVASARPHSACDHGAMAFSMIGICLPSFVLGPLLVLVFGLWLGWFPVSGWHGWSDRVLPAVTLGAAYAAYIAPLTRGGMLEVLSKDFIRTARAKGLGESAVVLRHGLKNGILPVISFLGPATAGLITGSFVVETIFQIPGLGRFFINAAFNRDYSMIMGTVLFYATLIILLNLLVDLSLAWLNPRMRQQQTPAAGASPGS